MPDDSDHPAWQFGLEPYDANAVVSGSVCEQWDQSRTKPSRDETLQGAVVVGLERVVDRVAERAKPVLDEQTTRALTRSDQCELTELA